MQYQVGYVKDKSVFQPISNICLYQWGSSQGILQAYDFVVLEHLQVYNLAIQLLIIDREYTFVGK